jgi:O-antigen biosynthesis protein WbqV
MKGKEPWRDIAIIETGLRPGERLHEELFHTFEKVIQTDVDGVMVASDTQQRHENLRGCVEKLLEAARLDQDTVALTWLQRILPSFGRADGVSLPFKSSEKAREFIEG